MIHRRPFHRRRPWFNRQPLFSTALPTPDPFRPHEGPVAMNALTLIYHEDLEPAITGIIQRKMLVARYTRVRDVVGARADIMHDMNIATQ